MKLILELLLLGSSALVANKSNAAQALAVAGNGKWAVAYDRTTDVKAVSAQALAKCKTRGGTDPKIVYTNWQNSNQRANAGSDNCAGPVGGCAFKNAGIFTTGWAIRLNKRKQEI